VISNRMQIKKILTTVLFIGYTMATLAQSSVTECEQTLARATDEFSAGHFYGLPSILKSCLEGNFTNEQRVRAYLLLTQAYLIIDDPIAAEDSYLKLLRANPEYIATPEKDPIDVVYLSQKFTTTPIFTPHLRIGANTSFARTIYDINLESDNTLVDTKQARALGLQFGGGIDWNINDNISLCADVLFSSKSFKTNKSSIAIHDSQSALEKQRWIDIPVYLKYGDSQGKVRPYGYVGYATNLLLKSTASLNYTNLDSKDNSVITDPADEKITYKRNRLNRSLVLGGGVRYKIGKDFIFADVRYMAGLSNLTNVETNYYSDGSFDLTKDATQTRWVGDYFRLDNLAISVGFVKPLYDPRKIKRARTHGLFRKINKQQKDDE
jgi:Outer membrane protein beta-barrel domain